MNQLKPILNDNVVIGPQSWLKLIIVSSYLIFWMIIFPFSKPIPITLTAGAYYLEENRMRNDLSSNWKEFTCWRWVTGDLNEYICLAVLIFHNWIDPCFDPNNILFK